MKKQPTTEIKSYTLDMRFHAVHKEIASDPSFGLDHTSDLVGGGFGLYSTANLRPRIGPLKSEFFRIGLVRDGEVSVDCGLETFRLVRSSAVFTYPSQLFSLYKKTDNLFAYYMFFAETFLHDFAPLKNIQEQFPFLDFSGVQHVALNNEEAARAESIILHINDEVRERKMNLRQSIQLYLHLLLIEVHRSYARQKLVQTAQPESNLMLLTKFKRLVAKHFIETRQVSAYSDMLFITPNHLNKTIKEHSGKTASQWIDEMLLLESKALLRYSEQTISEVAFALRFTDPAHFNHFFKKHTSLTPLQFRNEARQS